ncbi:hypothetical protein L9F63_005745 [Diploptera punctata]|uniref:Galectin n=1 Tax=Diploptera punctata TaxID=6984 RepID=A0AAD7ZC50_DIPPU|nr:hypothetical protein L9F63_005745 [Diploptera punctata]
MDTGRVVEVQGKVLSHATRFSLNLVCGSSPTADIAFHFNPRFDQNYVARNSRFSGRWGHEESSSPLKNPFHRGKKFNLTILAAEEEFMIAVNGFHFCSYAYRTMRLKIQAVQINGDVTITSLEYRMIDKYPEIIPDLKDPVVIITHEQPLSDSVTDKVELPLIVKLPTGFNIGKQIEIVGRTKLLPHSFYLNLQSDVFLWPHPAIFLHINPRFRTSTLIMNSWLKGTWGAEQSCPLHFSPGRPFSLKIKCNRDEFYVSYDGIHIGSYRYRASPHLIKAMYFQGDVLIKEITLSDTSYE